MVVTKRIQSNYSLILRAKVHFFFKKSIWRYLLGMLLLAWIYPLGTWGVAVSALFYFLVFVVVILVPVYHFSAKMMAKKNAFDADIEFNEQNIVIRHRDKDLTEVKEWKEWVKQIDIGGNAVFIVVNQWNRFVIIFPKDKLSADELQFFTRIRDERLR